MYGLSIFRRCSPGTARLGLITAPEGVLSAFVIHIPRRPLGTRHQDKLIDRARDEMYSHVIRCDVLKAEMPDRVEWLDETVDYLAHRFPQLDNLQLAHLRQLGGRFIRPAIPHGADTHARNRDEWQPALN